MIMPLLPNPLVAAVEADRTLDLNPVESARADYFTTAKAVRVKCKDLGASPFCLLRRRDAHIMS